MKISTVENNTKNNTKSINYIIREVPPEQTDFGLYFEDDGLTDVGGDYCYNLFIISSNRFLNGFNHEEYQRVKDNAEAIIDGFDDINNGHKHDYTSYKDVMEYNNIDYNSHKCKVLKEWMKTANIDKTNCIAEFLTITTGKEWSVDYATGYSQGDYVEMVYCPEHYTDGVKHYGEIYLGVGKEFCIIHLDCNKKSTDIVYGYIVADSQALHDEDYKKLVCKWACIPEQETQLQMIEESKTYTEYVYRKL